MALNEGTATTAPPVLHPADHQVAGHRFDEGRLGSSVDEGGRFYKPLQDGQRGDREIAFYNALQKDDKVPPHIRAFFPKYFETIFIEAPNTGGAIRHGVMEDLAHGFRHPCIIDLKIGYRTWYPEASDHSREKNKLKDKQTTSGALGFRVSGMQVFDSSSGGVFRADRDWARNLSVDGVLVALKRYVSSNPRNETDPDLAFARAVYGEPHGVLAQLSVLEDWFRTQTKYHFASSSLLFIYEGDSSKSTDDDTSSKSPPTPALVKLVDFAHTISGKESVDDNFLRGLQSVIRCLSSVIEPQQ